MRWLRCERMLIVFTFLGSCLFLAEGQTNAVAATNEQWATTIDIAGRQRMLSQRMSKEILMVAYGLGSKSQVQASVDLFDQSLNDITNGNSALNILAAPSQKIKDRLQAVLDTWTPFKKLLMDNLDTIQNSDQTVKADIGNQIGTESVALLTRSNDAVLDLITFAKVSSAATATDVVNIASRQRMIIQRMAKEALLVGLGLDFVKALKTTSELFSTSHEGIILGAPWAGVSTLTKVCTMSQMARVSDQWKQFKPLVEGIVGAESKEKSIQSAFANAQTVTEKTDTFFTEMADAVKLFIEDSGTCDVLTAISLAQWGKLIGNVGKQRFLGMQVCQLYMQIILDVQPQSSQVELTVQSVATQAHIRTLIEGNLESNSPTAPTQGIVDSLLNAYVAWSDLKAELDRIINTGFWDDKSVERVAQLGVQHLDIMNLATDVYVQLAKQYAPSMNSEKIDIAGRQRMIFQKMSFESSLINFGKGNWQAFEGSVTLWLATHWDLLLGNAVYNITRTTDVCVVQKMKLAKDQFDLLHTAAKDAANGNRNKIEDVISINPIAFKEMNDAVGYYSSVDAISCDLSSNSVVEWQAELIELGRLRALSQQVLSEMFLEMMFSNNSLASAFGTFEDTLKRVTFGDGSRDIPAPATQALLDSIIKLGDTWPAFKAALSAKSTNTNNNSAQAQSLAMLAGVNDVIQQNMDEISDGLVFKRKIDLMSNQLMLANKAVKEAAGLSLNVNDDKVMQDTISAYERMHSQLANEAKEIQDRTGRTDLQSQLGKVNAAWTELKKEVEVLASMSGITLKQQMELLSGVSGTSAGIGGTSATEQQTRLKDALQALTQEIDAAVLLYGIANPADIPPEPPGPPWTLILYLCIGFAILSVCCLAVVNAGACACKKGGVDKDTGKQSWQMGTAEGKSEETSQGNQKKQQKADQAAITDSKLPHKGTADLESARPPATTPPAAGGVKSL